MNRIKYPLILPSSPKEEIYTYEVKINNTNTIFRGKIFNLPNNTSILLDLTDLLTNWQFKGLNMLAPVYDTTQQQYVPQTAGNTFTFNATSPEQHKNYVNVVVYNKENTEVFRLNKYITFHSISFQNSVLVHTLYDRNNNSLNYYFGDLVPRFPSGNNLVYKQLIDTNISAGAGSIWKYKNGTVINSDTVASTGTIKSVKYPTQHIYDGDYKILHIDECNAPYYLLYITASGGFQSQPFYSVKYSEALTTNTKITVDEQKDISNLVINGKWNLKSQNLTNKQYQEMMDIARSPYIYLYITEIGKGVFVNCLDTTIEKKENNVDSNKPIYFEINLESREAQLNIF